MAKKSFKVEDKVELRDPMSRIQGNNMGTVRRFPPKGVIVEWSFDGKGGVNTSFYLLEEIKHVCQKGTQLLLFDL